MVKRPASGLGTTKDSVASGLGAPPRIPTLTSSTIRSKMNSITRTHKLFIKCVETGTSTNKDGSYSNMLR